MGGYHYSLYMQLLQNCTNKLLQEGFVQLTFYPNMFVFFKKIMHLIHNPLFPFFS